MLTKDELPECPVATTVQLIGNKWKLLILRNLVYNSEQRFSDFLKSIPGISKKVLTDDLRALESDGIIEREVFAEVPYVREKLGWIPLVTPTSQIVGTQAMMNVKFGRWKMFTPQAMDIALGYYGRTPAPVDPEVRKLAQEKSKKDPIDCRPADLKKPGMEDLRKALREKGIKDDDEHCVIYAMFPQQLEDYYAGKRPEPPTAKPKQENYGAPIALTSVGVAASISGHDMKLNIMGREYDVHIEEQ